MVAFNVQSVDGFLGRLLTDGSLHSWLPIEVGWNFKVIRLVSILLLVGMTVWICWRADLPGSLEEENLEFSIFLCLALIISPISWTHYYLFLLLPLSLYLGNGLALPQERLWSNLVLVSALLVSLPVKPAPRLLIPGLKPIGSKLLISHYFFGGVLLLGVLLAARWYTSKRPRLPQAAVEGYEIARTS